MILYDSGKFKLARRRKLRYDEIKIQAEEYFQQKYEKARKSFRIAELSLQETFYEESAFSIHQTMENLIYATRLTFTLTNDKQHNLTELLDSVKKYSAEFMTIFPRHNPEEKRLFELAKAAYVEARYNPKFVVTKEDIEALIPRVQQLFKLVDRICRKKIEEYEELSKTE